MMPTILRLILEKTVGKGYWPPVNCLRGPSPGDRHYTGVVMFFPWRMPPACAGAKRLLSLALALLVWANLAFAAGPPLMPWPASAEFHPGQLAIGVDFSISVAGAGAADPRVKAAVARTFIRLARQTGLPL